MAYLNETGLAKLWQLILNKITNSVADTVKYTEQTLTDTEKQQARTNIGITPSSTTPKALDTASVGSETAYARGDHVHPKQTTITGNAGTATKLAAAKTISLTGDVTGSASFDGSTDISITAAVTSNSHYHSASNITTGTFSTARLPTVPIEKGGTGATDALNAMLNLKGLPVISAVGSSYDMNTIAETGELALYSYNGNTLNTPYKAGLTSATLGYILNIPNDNYPTQLALGHGATRPYYRAGKAGTWIELAVKNDITSGGSVSYPISVANGGTGATDAATARTNLGITPANIGASVYTPIAYTEIDNISASGIYRTTGTPGLLIHMNWDVNYAYQILNLYSGNNGLMGRYKHSNGSWQAWTELDNRDYIKNVSNDTTLTIGLDGNVTPVITGLKGGKAKWAIGGYTADLNHLVVHNYNDGVWTGGLVLLDSGNYANYANTKITAVKSGNTSVAVNGTLNIGSISGVKQYYTSINGANATISLYGSSEGSINATYYSKTDNKFLTYGVGFTYTSAGALTITNIVMYQVDSNGLRSSYPSSVTIGNVYAIS